MPTPAKLVAAIAMALVGWATGEAYLRFSIDAGAAPALLREVGAALGLVIGWRVLGSAATGPRGKGDRLMQGMTAGLTSAAILVCLGLALHAVEAVVVSPPAGFGVQTLDTVLADLVEAVLDAARGLVEPRILGVVFGGGAFAGLAAGVAGRIWW